MFFLFLSEHGRGLKEKQRGQRMASVCGRMVLKRMPPLLNRCAGRRYELLCCVQILSRVIWGRSGDSFATVCLPAFCRLMVECAADYYDEDALLGVSIGDVGGRAGASMRSWEC